MAVALIAVVACVLFACVPSNLDKAKTKMEDAGYTVIAVEKSYEGFEGGFSATKVSISEGSGQLFAFYFKDSKSAKAAYDKMGDSEKKEKSDIIKLKGKWIYIGSEAAIKAFEK